MKKMLSMVLTIALLLSMIPATIANAASEDDTTFSTVVDKASVAIGETVVVTVNITENPGIMGAEMEVTWPEGTFEFVSSTANSAYSSNSTVNNAKIVWMDAANIETTGEFFEVTLKAIQAGTHTISLEGYVTNYDAEEWTPALQTTNVTVTDASIPTTGYTATMTTSASNNEVVSGSNINVNVAVSHSSDTEFNAGEIKLTYDSAKLTPNATSLDSMVTAGTLSGYKVNGNELIIEDFGGDKTIPYTYSIPFTAAEVSTETTDTVTLTRAAFIHKDNASSSDLIEATKSPESLTVTIKVAMVNVTLINSTDNTSTTTTTQKGVAYIFAPSDTANYTYSNVIATVGSNNVTVTDNGDGTFTIAAEDVTGDISLTYTKTAKSYTVSYEGAGAGDLTTKPETATYGQELTVTLPADIPAGTSVGYTYGISAKIGETAVGTYNSDTRTLTIQGTDITGNIIITVTKDTVSATDVTITVAGDSGLTIKGVTGNTTTVTIGDSVTLVLTEEAGYTYEVVDSKNNEVTFTDGEYTFTANESVTFTATKTLNVETVQVTEYVKVDNYIIYLVTYDGTLASGKVPTYDSNVMFWSDKYDAYCWLVIDNTLTADTAKTKIGAQTSTATEVDYGMDINGTNVTDAADAQLVWNMYNALYSDFSTVSMANFLAADQNATSTETANWGLNVQDAQVIITAILEGNATT